METKNKLFNSVIGALTAICLGLLAYDAKVLVEQGQTIAVLHNQVQSVSGRVDKLEGSGSPNLMSHVKDDDNRIGEIKVRLDKLEAAFMGIASLPGELKAISARLDMLDRGQIRIENSLDEHKKTTAK